MYIRPSVWSHLMMVVCDFQLVLTIIMQSFEEIFYLIELMGFGFSVVLTCVFAGQIYLRYKEPDLERPIKVSTVFALFTARCA